MMKYLQRCSTIEPEIKLQFTGAVAVAVVTAAAALPQAKWQVQKPRVCCLRSIKYFVQPPRRRSTIETKLGSRTEAQIRAQYVLALGLGSLLFSLYTSAHLPPPSPPIRPFPWTSVAASVLVCMLQTCFITGPRFSELKEQRLGLILILTDKRCLRLFAVDSSPAPWLCTFCLHCDKKFNKLNKGFNIVFFFLS